MSRQALFVDLSNFYSCLLKPGLADDKVLRDYFLYWLYFDRLAVELTGEPSPVWIFYSGSRIGPSNTRIEGKFLKEYIERVNSLEGVTARDVNIPGDQRESAKYQCECGKEGFAEWISEKGIDSSLIVHLFDTMDAWDVAYLLSGDADYVPAVSSLRRRGKIVAGVGFSNASSALIRECYNYLDLSKTFIKEDILAFKIFKKEGVAYRWLREPVQSVTAAGSLLGSVTLTVGWRLESIRPGSYDSANKDFSRGNWSSVRFEIDACDIDMNQREKHLKELEAKFPDNIAISDYSNVKFCFAISPTASIGTERRLDEIKSQLKDCSIEEGGPEEMAFRTRYFRNEGKWEISKLK